MGVSICQHSFEDALIKERIPIDVNFYGITPIVIQVA